MRHLRSILCGIAIILVPFLALAQETVQPASLAYNVQFIGTQSAAQSVRIKNVGTQKVSITISISGDFVITSNGCTDLHINSFCDVSVAYAPTPAELSSGNLGVSDSAGNSVQVPLKGTPTGITISPAFLDFGSIPVGATSPAKSVTVSNIALQPLTVSGVTVTGAFEQTNTCGASLAGLSSCTVSVTFTPTNGDEFGGSLSITTSDPVQPRVGLNGKGIADPRPTIFNPTQPDSARVGSPKLTLLVHGAGFISSSKVYWNGSALHTTVLSSSQLQAVVPARYLAAPTAAHITVINPPPIGGSSNALLFEVSDHPTSSIVFQRTDYPVLNGPYTLAVGDLNNDQSNDLVVGSNGLGGVTVLLGSATGQFTIKGSYGGTAQKVVLGDFNDDGYLDVEYTGGLLLNNGDGSLRGPYYPPFQAAAIATGDFNRDGYLDMVYLYSTGQLTSPADVFSGHGDGTFTPGSTFAYSPFGRAVVTGDFNSDGNLDLAFIDNFKASSITIALGDGTGRLSVNSHPVTGGSNPWDIAAADFNGDGKMDLAVIDRDNHLLTILLGNGDGTFQAPLISSTDGLQPFSIAVGDMNADGIPDLAIAFASSKVVGIAFGRGDGTFPTGEEFNTGNLPRAVVIDDFNRDGHPDLAVANWNSNSVSVFQQVPYIVFTPASIAFSKQKVGTVSPSQPVTLQNTGSTDLNLSSINLTGADPADFSLANHCPASLVPGDSCTLDISFQPTATGARSASITANSNAPNPAAVKLKGSGTK
jgi:hypothetical protein